MKRKVPSKRLPWLQLAEAKWRRTAGKSLMPVRIKKQFAHLNVWSIENSWKIKKTFCIKQNQSDSLILQILLNVWIGNTLAKQTGIVTDTIMK